MASTSLFYVVLQKYVSPYLLLGICVHMKNLLLDRGLHYNYNTAEMQNISRTTISESNSSKLHFATISPRYSLKLYLIVSNWYHWIKPLQSRLLWRNFSIFVKCSNRRRYTVMPIHLITEFASIMKKQKEVSSQNNCDLRILSMFPIVCEL